MKLDIDFRFILTAGMLMLLKTDTADTFASVSGEGKREKKKKDNQKTRSNLPL